MSVSDLQKHLSIHTDLIQDKLHALVDTDPNLSYLTLTKEIVTSEYYHNIIMDIHNNLNYIYGGKIQILKLSLLYNLPVP